MMLDIRWANDPPTQIGLLARLIAGEKAPGLSRPTLRGYLPFTFLSLLSTHSPLISFPCLFLSLEQEPSLKIISSGLA
jgi:hypothetical protein